MQNDLNCMMFQYLDFLDYFDLFRHCNYRLFINPIRMDEPDNNPPS